MAQGLWTRDQLLVAFRLYTELPFGKMHSRNPEIIRFASLIGRTPSALAMKLTNIASLDPAIRATGRTGLIGASATDRRMWAEMNENWDRFVEEAARVTWALTAVPADIDFNDPTDFTGVDRPTIGKARVGQIFFRNAVLSAYDFACCITGLSEPRLLVASHIVPWSHDAGTRLNPRNGLCLSAIHDKAFDLGMITIDEEWKVRVAPRYRTSGDRFFRKTVNTYNGKVIRMPEKFSPSQEFLEYHRNNIFDA